MSIFRQRWMCGVTSSGTGTLTDVLYVRSLLVRRYDGLDIILSPEKWVGSRRACTNKWPTEKSQLYIQFLCNPSAMQTPSAVRPAFSRMGCMSLAIQCILMDSNTVDFRSGQRPPARYRNSPMTQSRIRNFCDRVLAENWGSEKHNCYVRYFLEYQQNQINISGWTHLHKAIDLGHSSLTKIVTEAQLNPCTGTLKHIPHRKARAPNIRILNILTSPACRYSSRNVLFLITHVAAESTVDKFRMI